LRLREIFLATLPLRCTFTGCLFLCQSNKSQTQTQGHNLQSQGQGQGLGFHGQGQRRLPVNTN